MLINFNHLKTFYNALVQKLKSFRGNWEQNDPSADDYIKNRPFYSEVNTGDLVSNLDSENYNNGNYPPCTFIEGHKYDVVWNGTLYKDVICTLDDPYHVLVVDGVFYIDDDGGNGLYISSEEDEDFVVSITGPSEIVHPIDSKYLPGDLVTRDDLSEALPDNLVTTANIADALPAEVVRGDIAQSLTTAQKAQARTNIGAGTSNFSGSYSDLTNKPTFAAIATSGSYNDLTNKPTIYTDVVRYTEQDLAENNKTAARVNIGAASTEDIANLRDSIYASEPSVFEQAWDGKIDNIEDKIEKPENTKFNKFGPQSTTITNLYYYKISDMVLPLDDIINAKISLATNNTFKDTVISQGINCYSMRVTSLGAYPQVIVVTVPGDCVAISYEDYDETRYEYKFSATSSGIYLRGGASVSNYVNNILINYTIEQSKLYLNNITGTYKVGVEADGALSTTDSNGNVVTMAKNTVYKISTISLPASGWTEATNVYSQVVSVTGATANSQVDLYPTPEQLIDMQISGISLVAVNEDGVVTVYALNNKPTSDYSMQVTLTEVNEGV